MNTFLRFRENAIAAKGPELVLESISASHFVEATRWALDRLGIPYNEEESIGIVGILLTARTVPRLHITSSRSEISNSRDIFRFLYGRYKHLGTNVQFLNPVSADDVELEDAIEKFGDEVRRWMYYHGWISSGKRRIVALRAWGAFQPNIPAWQRLLLRVLEPALSSAILVLLNVNEESYRESLIRMKKSFDIVDGLLADDRRYLMKTAQPTYIDIMWASYCALLFLPPQYAGGRLAGSSSIAIADLGKSAVAEAEELMRRPAGCFARRMYAENRMESLAAYGSLNADPQHGKS